MSNEGKRHLDGGITPISDVSTIRATLASAPIDAPTNPECANCGNPYSHHRNFEGVLTCCEPDGTLRFTRPFFYRAARAPTPPTPPEKSQIRLNSERDS